MKYSIIEDVQTFSFSESSFSECPIFLQNNFEHLTTVLSHIACDNFFLLTDSNVAQFYGNELYQQLDNTLNIAKPIIITPGEKSKTLDTVAFIGNQVLEHGITKRSCLLILGGGVLGNIGGLVAALLFRGIKFVHIPTTVMAQVDSTTGCKQGVNTQYGKNTLGTFYEAECIFINTSTIETLAEREYKSGIAECIKHGFCQSETLLEEVMEGEYKNILPSTIQFKTKILQKDPFEKEIGKILIYGHTIGHVLETITQHYYTHGEAVSIGMVAAAKISEKMGFAEKGLIQKHKDILENNGLPTCIDTPINIDEAMQVLLYDKKIAKTSKTFVLLEDIGKLVYRDNSYAIPVPDYIIRETIQELTLKS